MNRLAFALLLAFAPAAQAIVLTHTQIIEWQGRIPDYEPGHEFDFHAWAPPEGDTVESVSFHWLGLIDPPGARTRLYAGPFFQDGSELTLTDLNFPNFLADPFVGLNVTYDPQGVDTPISPFVSGQMTMAVLYDPPESTSEPISLLLLGVGLLSYVVTRIRPVSVKCRGVPSEAVQPSV